MPRNAFELGLAALTILKNKLGENVQIYSAGSEWDPYEYGMGGILKNLGKLPYSTLPRFYSSMDCGLMFMFSGHPGVVASELMASGCPVVVNEYEDKTWNSLYINDKTCIVSTPTAAIIAHNIERALTDARLRENIIPAARNKVKEFYGDYDSSCKEASKSLFLRS